MARKKKTMQQVDEAKQNPSPAPSLEDNITRMYRHYQWGVQDMDTRRVRKNGWNEVINAYMSRLPTNWPYNSIVTLPLVRTTILEKTGRLLNSKLQGRLIPRNEAADAIKAKINNAILDFQWDFANEGGTMFEKIALADQYARIFGAAFTLNYWDTVRCTNEIKIIDPRDIFFDGAANHVRNCKWIQVREFTTLDKLEQRGYDVKNLIQMADEAQLPPMRRDTNYESIVKANRDLVDRTGEIDDMQNPVIEVVTEWGYDRKQVPYMRMFLPKYLTTLEEKAGDQYPYKHGKLPISMLRYYPLLDDIYGESEVEGVLPLQRAANAMVCGFLDEANIKMRPPLKIAAQGVRIETIEYGPGARWIMNSPELVQEHTGSPGFIQTFNTVFPMIVSQFDTAMGNQSLGVSQSPTGATAPTFGDKTATEVRSLSQQQNIRDQYNQSYLAEFLKDIMMQWLENNKQFLFDDPTKKYYILKVVGKEAIQELQSMGLSDTEIPEDAMNQISDTVANFPGAMEDSDLEGLMSDLSLPKNPVVLNPTDEPQDYQVKNKLSIAKNGTEAELYIVPEDFEGEYEYIPDVKSMSAGAGQTMRDARQNILQTVLNPQVMQMLQTQGDSINIKELLIGAFEDAGYKDAEALFNQGDQNLNGQANTGGQAVAGPGQPGGGVPVPPGMGAGGQAIPPQSVGAGIPAPQQIPGV